MNYLAFLLFLAFTNPENPTIHAEYGRGSMESKSGYNLVLNEDGTFHFADFSRKPALEVSGNWTESDQKIKLSPNTSENKIPTQWKKEKELPCIKARKGIGFYRICLKN